MVETEAMGERVVTEPAATPATEARGVMDVHLDLPVPLG